MNLLVELKKAALVFLVALVCFDLVPTIQAVSPPPDGCYPNYTTAEGCNALQHLGAGVGNTGVGSYSLFSAGDSNFNTGVGAGTLVLNTGNDNTAVGFTALLLNTTGESNTAVGTDALALNIGAFTNTAVGSFAAQNNDSSGAGHANFNTAVGGFALQANVDGSENTAVGAGALGLANGGDRNTAVGEGAGGCITTHSNIIAIGADVCGVSTAFGEVDNACYIGNIAGATVSAGTFAFVLVDADGKLGTLTMDANGNKVSIPGLKGANPRHVQLQTIGPDPKQAMLNRKVEKQQATIAELKSTVAQQQKQMEVFTAQLKEQAAQIQKVSARIEMSHPLPQMVVNNH